jgi:hypothetical protein
MFWVDSANYERLRSYSYIATLAKVRAGVLGVEVCPMGQAVLG